MCSVGLFAVLWKTCIPKLNIEVDGDIFTTPNIAPCRDTPKLRFYLVGPGIAQMIDANRTGAIEGILRTRKLPISFQLGYSKVTLIVDFRNYDKSGDWMGMALSVFKADRSSDLRRSFSEIEIMFPQENANLKPSESMSDINTKPTDQESKESKEQVGMVHCDGINSNGISENRK